MEKLIEKNYYLHKSAQEAYKSYVRAYDSHSLKQIYNVSTLNLLMVALSFGFKVPPYVDLSILYSRLTLLGKLKGKLVLPFACLSSELVGIGFFFCCFLCVHILNAMTSLLNLCELFSLHNSVLVIILSKIVA